MKRTSFDPKSPDAMFATIITRLDKQDETTEERHEENKETLGDILTEARRTNGRVSKLEQKWKYALGWLAGASFILALIWVAVLHFIH